MTGRIVQCGMYFMSGFSPQMLSFFEIITLLPSLTYLQTLPSFFSLALL